MKMNRCHFLLLLTLALATLPPALADTKVTREEGTGVNEVDVDLSAYRALIRASAAQMGFDWMLKFLEVDGFPVRQEFRMGPIESWQQVVSISEEPAPNRTYEPPTGYTKSD